jgi:adenosylcobinamide kinase/adenosylcobinamide-phosphate guanylyltransferase
MELILGGAYQGKAEYAREKLGAGEIYACTEDTLIPDFSSGCASHLEMFALNCVRRGVSPRDELAAREEEWRDAILIADDISQGIVPLGAEMRLWREETGRMLAYLAGSALHVHRVFLGIGQVIK